MATRSHPVEQSLHQTPQERSLRAGIRDGGCQAIALGGGENYLSAFALLLHATPLQIGILSALPQLIGTWAQLFSVKAMNRLVHRKALVLWGAMGQTVSWLPIFALPLLVPDHAAWLLIGCVVLYFALGHFTIPPWNGLITDLVDPNQRGIYFARRSRVMAVASFAALCGGGFLLNMGQGWGAAWAGFALIFLAAAVSRGLSAFYLSRLTEPEAATRAEAAGGFRWFLTHGATGDFRRFLLFAGSMHVCVLIAGPFFVIYMLRDLHFSYLQYAGWLAMGTLGQFLTLKHWGRISDRYGNKQVLRITGIIVPFLPMLYLIGTALPFLLCVNFLGGAVWAGLSLGLQNYVFDAVRQEDRPTGVAMANTVNAVGWFLGAMLGSWLATVMPDEVHVASFALHPASNLPLVFCVSGLLRLLVSACLLGTFREPRAVEPISSRRLVWELPLIKPLVQWLPTRRTRLE